MPCKFLQAATGTFEPEAAALISSDLAEMITPAVTLNCCLWSVSEVQLVPDDLLIATGPSSAVKTHGERTSIEGCKSTSKVLSVSIKKRREATPDKLCHQLCLSASDETMWVTRQLMAV